MKKNVVQVVLIIERGTDADCICCVYCFSFVMRLGALSLLFSFWGVDGVRGGGGTVGVVRGKFALWALDINLKYGSLYTTYIVDTI